MRRTVIIMNQPEDDFLNIDETAAWLKIPRSTLYKLCTDGEIPAAKVGRQWRFHRSTVEKWFFNKMDAGKREKA